MALTEVRSAPALPANTWAGTPPPAPGDNRPTPSPEAESATPPASGDAGGAPQPAPAAAGDDHRDGGPTPPPPATPAPAPSASSSAAPATFNLVGGSATISCSSGAPALVSATPQPGFALETGTEDGGATLDIRFRSSSHESRLDAYCSGGAVKASIEESSS